MPLKTFVLVSNINNLSDARYCAGMGVDVLGFDLDTASPNLVAPEKFNELANWVSGVSFAGNIGHTLLNEEQAANLFDQYPLNYVISSRVENLSTFKTLNPSIQLIGQLETTLTTLSPEVLRELENLSVHTDFLLITLGEIEFDKGLAMIKRLSDEYPILLKNDLEVEQLLMAVETTSIKGISLSGGDEIRPGFKYFDQLADVLESLEIED